MVIYEKKVIFCALITFTALTNVFPLSVSADSSSLRVDENPQGFPENKSQRNLTRNVLQKRPRQADEDDDDSVFERITKGFNRVISTAFKGTVGVVFGTENEDGDREDGIIPNLVKSPLVKPALNALLQGGLSGSQSGKPGRPTKTNVTKQATVIVTTTQKNSEEVEDDEEDSDDER